jgi:hypothetical protein
MALTSQEEALVRELLSQQAAILSLASNEATITSKLGANKITLTDLLSASFIADADLFLVRQGLQDKSATAALLADYFVSQLADIFVQVAGDTMQGPLSLFGGDTGEDPAQFDNSQALATSGFVRGEGIQARGVRTVSSSPYAVVADDAGGIIYTIGGSGVINLPSVNSWPVGKALIIQAAVPTTVNRNGSQVIYANSSGQASLTLGDGDSVTLHAVPALNGWIVVTGAGQLGRAAVFKSLLSQNGYQKLPSGVIVQWGYTGVFAQDNVSYVTTFPIAFPGICVAVLMTDNADTNEFAGVKVSSRTTANFTASKINLQGISASHAFFYIAVGY